MRRTNPSPSRRMNPLVIAPNEPKPIAPNEPTCHFGSLTASANEPTGLCSRPTIQNGGTSGCHGLYSTRAVTSFGRAGSEQRTYSGPTHGLGVGRLVGPMKSAIFNLSPRPTASPALRIQRTGPIQPPVTNEPKTCRTDRTVVIGGQSPDLMNMDAWHHQ